MEGVRAKAFCSKRKSRVSSQGQSGWWIRFRKVHLAVIPAKLALASASGNPERLDSRFRGKAAEGTFRTNEVRILRKAPDVSSGKYYTSFCHRSP